MQGFIDNLIRGWGYDPASWPWTQFVYVAFMGLFSLIVVGIIMSGWSSNSKWSLFGAIRSAAQIISYEIPAGMALMIPVLLAGTMSTQGIIRAQGPWPWQWFIFDDPAATAAFFIFFISALAERNRTPFA